MKKAFFVKVVGLLLCAAMLSFSALALGEDAAGHWAESTLKSFVASGYLKGDENGMLRPNAPITRAEFAALVNRVAGFVGSSDAIDAFSDVSAGAWYRDALSTALAAGYLKGSGHMMMPGESITREQAFAVITRILDLKSADEAVLSGFSDGHRTSVWARPEVAAIVAVGYVNGNADGTLNPLGSLTRAEAATLLSNVHSLIKDIGRAGDKYIYGKAELSYADFYAGDADIIPAGTEAASKAPADLVNIKWEREKYTVTGVKNVSVAVPAAYYEAYLALEPSFVPDGSGEAPSRYKTVSLKNGRAEYSGASSAVTAISDASAKLSLAEDGSFLMEVTDGANKYLSADDGDGLPIGAELQGVILETREGLRVGLAGGVGFGSAPGTLTFAADEKAPTARLLGQYVVKITYILPDRAYEYSFRGVRIKIPYPNDVTGFFANNYGDFTLNTMPFELSSARMSVKYVNSMGDPAELYSGFVSKTVPLKSGDLDISDGGYFEVVLTSGNYEDIYVSVAGTEGQFSRLKGLAEEARLVLTEHRDEELRALMREANKLARNEWTASKELADAISELDSMLQKYRTGGTGDIMLPVGQY